MLNDPAHHITRDDGIRLAYRHRSGSGPTIVFLPGYMSDMNGAKALALDGWAAKHGRAMLRLDYSGCGESGGDFADGTLARWRDDALAVIDAATQGPLILVGSSMGGWLMLLAALARADRVVGLVGIAAAPDFTEWGYDAAARATLLREGRLEEPSAYSDAPFVTTRAFWESGQACRLLDAPVPFSGPVRLLHGQADADVPWEISIRLAAALTSPNVRVTLVKDGDHRLSRESDIGLLTATVTELAESLDKGQRTVV